MGAPALVKILVLFAGIVALYRLKVPLWADVLLMSVAAGLWFGKSVADTLRTAGATAVGEEVLFLAAVVLLIQGLGHMLNGTGVLKRIVGAVGELLGKSMYSAAALPALVGLLPMPGGAVFSAPMVDTACGTGSCLTAEEKGAVNHWFRHIWEYWWPMYPGVILASQLFHTTVWKMALLHLPLTAAAVTGGYFFILRRAFGRDVGEVANNGNGRSPGSLRRALAESAPIIVVVVSIFTFGPLMGVLGVEGIAGNYWPVIGGVIIGMLWLAVAKKVGPRRIFKFMIARDQVSMVLIATGTMVFKDMLVSVNAFEAARVNLQAYHVPAIVVIAALPFISGMVMGLTIGFVGGSFPLVISLLPAAVMETHERFAYMALAYSFGYMGMLLSPVHLCLILTKDFFKADFWGMYKVMLPAAGVVFVAGVMLFVVYLKVFG